MIKQSSLRKQNDSDKLIIPLIGAQISFARR